MDIPDLKHSTGKAQLLSGKSKFRVRLRSHQINQIDVI